MTIIIPDGYWEQMRVEHIAIAEALGVRLVPDPYTDSGVELVYEAELPEWPQVQVHRMLFNYRLSVIDVPGVSFTRYWCYKGATIATFVDAVTALAGWGGDPAGEPARWLKSWDGRYAS